MKEEKGSAAIFVLVGLLFMASYLLILYGNNINKEKALDEQINIISGIYYKGLDNDSYEKAYTSLREKNIETKEKSEASGTIEITNCVEGSLSNYKIYGSEAGLGTSVTVKIYKSADDITPEEITFEIPTAIQSSDGYIDYKNEMVTINGVSSTDISTLPKIPIYEDYTKIEIQGASRIDVEYEGYTVE